MRTSFLLAHLCVFRVVGTQVSRDRFSKLSFDLTGVTNSVHVQTILGKMQEPEFRPFAPSRKDDFLRHAGVSFGRLTELTS